MHTLSAVLVAPQGPINVGLAARACANFAAALRLVTPRVKPSDEQAKTFASGAQKVLREAQIFDSLEAALADQHMAIGFTARARAQHPPATAFLEAAPTPAGHRIALVFGHERNGLSNQDIARCTHLQRLPTDVGYPSMNLSHAVALGLVWWRTQRHGPTNDAPQASIAHKEAALERLSELLADTGYFERVHADRLRPKLRRALAGKAWSTAELQLLNGVVEHLRKHRS